MNDAGRYIRGETVATWKLISACRRFAARAFVPTKKLLASRRDRWTVATARNIEPRAQKLG